ncbi:hypothetical protein GCM10022223_14810 [Kineosporia mesophila]|uniref:Uncharacterized protein n=1 Tax=Kineosporia mesophila TaxID=566012 RepID=A0ABP6Z7L4_9ACTN|nr:nuclear transport factor 2 family protein [Kineosporia mesophila]MCD5352958.1 nuclear transport factor 2 family protein [Kineosporia mesophila]
MYRSRLDRDSDLLHGLPDPGHTLTHMTCYRSSRTEWLQQIGSGETRYLSARPVSVAVEVADGEATVVDQAVVDTTRPGLPGHLESADGRRSDGPG